MSVAEDLSFSKANITGYWKALKKSALSSLEPNDPMDLIPDKNSLWPMIRYKQFADLENSPANSSDLLTLWVSGEKYLRGVQISDSFAWSELCRVKTEKEFIFASGSFVSNELFNKLVSAMDKIQTFWPEAHAELLASLWAVVWILPSSLPVSSLSNPKRFGIIHLNPRVLESASDFRIATDLIHECAHHALYVETAIDRLFQRDWEKPLWSPIRGEHRPAIGVLHGLFASYRMLIWSKKMQLSDDVQAKAEAARIKRKLLPGFSETVLALKSFPLTSRGQALLSALRIEGIES